MYMFCGIRFCTDLDSPEVLLTFVMPLIFIYYSIINGIEEKIAISYGIIFGILIYISATVLKNIAAKCLNSEQASKIPPC